MRDAVSRDMLQIERRWSRGVVKWMAASVTVNIVNIRRGLTRARVTSATFVTFRLRSRQAFDAA